ncbi:MAG: penicillin-binding protein 2 [Calditrichaeota bacterium]|nr:penicillin-binding protein 2 [Calditrichota bacterium]
MNYWDRSFRTKRLIIFSSFIIFSFTILVLGFFNLQVLQGEYYLQLSLHNVIRQVKLNPVRGLIYDSKNNLLVDNRPAFSAALIPAHTTKETVKKIADYFNIPVKNITYRLRSAPRFRPVIIARDIEKKKLIYLAENQYFLPGLDIILDSKRYYPKDVNSPHIFGYIGEVNQKEQERDPRYELGDMIGKAGLERYYDTDLRGTKGIRYIRVDASGKELGDFNPQLNEPPIHGSDLYLTLDYDLQKFAESLMEDKRGSLVAIDVRSGGILAMVSNPDYDIRLLSGKIDPEIWRTLLQDESHPLYGRSIQSAYPPGSTYKIVTAIAALQDEIITPAWEAYCPGYFRLGRRIIRCWKLDGHGWLDLYGAIKNSCNVYFSKLGLKIGLKTWSKYSKLLGFGKRTGIDLPNENPGLIPTIEYFNKIYGENGWTKGNLANLAIGQGELLTTPLQIAQFAMILANRGLYHRPHLVDHIYNYQTQKTIYFPVQSKYVVGVSSEVFDVVREGMHQVVNGGTGWLGKVPGIDMAGKTGTAQNPHGDPHAWFMAFAPYYHPEVAIAVMVENAGSGGGVAAPIGRKFLEMYFYHKLIPRPVIKKDSLQVEPAINPIQSVPLDSLSPLPILNQPGTE